MDAKKAALPAFDFSTNTPANASTAAPAAATTPPVAVTATIETSSNVSVGDAKKKFGGAKEKPDAGAERVAAKPKPKLKPKQNSGRGLRMKLNVKKCEVCGLTVYPNDPQLAFDGQLSMSISTSLFIFILNTFP